MTILVLKPTVTWGSHMDENMGDIVVFTQIWRDENGAIGCCTADLHGPSHSPTIVGVFLQTNNSSKTLPGSIRGLVPEPFFAGDSRNRNDRGERKPSNVLKGWRGYAVSTTWVTPNLLFDIICCSLGRESKHMVWGLSRISCNAQLIKYDDDSTGICHNECLMSQQVQATTPSVTSTASNNYKSRSKLLNFWNPNQSNWGTPSLILWVKTMVSSIGFPKKIEHLFQDVASMIFAPNCQVSKLL